MQQPCPYGFGKTLELDYDQALARITRLFGERGFNILYQVDMRQALRGGAGDGFHRYMIIGAIPTGLALRAFGADANIGLLLPCSVIVYEEEGGRSRVMAMDPAHLMDLMRLPETLEVAIEIKEELEALIERM